MLPLLAIGGVIGALFSIGKGASWVAEHATPSQEGSASADKSAGTAQSAQAAAFSAALAAQGAGQSVPGPAVAALAPGAAATTVAPTGGIVTLTQGTDYDTLARVQAGIAAYGKVGDGHAAHGGAVSPPRNGNDPPPPVTTWDGTARKISGISAS
jgi:hypothetical protein